MNKTILALPVFFMLALAGCTASGPTYSSLPEQKPDKGMAQLVVYRPNGLAYAARRPTVEINSIKTCDLPAGGFFIKNVKPSEITITSSFWDAPGTSRFTTEAVSGKTYHIRITLNNDKLGAGLVAGFIGTAVAEGVSEHSGPFNIELVDDRTAYTEINSLKMADCKP